MIYKIKRVLPIVTIAFLLVLIVSCEKAPVIDNPENLPEVSATRTPGLVTYTGSNSTSHGEVYEILPGASVINPAMNPTPFSNNIKKTDGSYSLSVEDRTDTDSRLSTDEVRNVDVEFTANNGRRFKIDRIRVIHKPDGAGDHTFFGGVGLNKEMHGNTGIGTNLMPRMLAYITLWGVTDLKDAETGKVIAANRIVHLMVASRVRDENLDLITDVDTDKSDHNPEMAETHLILIPFDMEGNKSPVPGTDHGFIHMMWEQVDLTIASREYREKS